MHLIKGLLIGTSLYGRDSKVYSFCELHNLVAATYTGTTTQGHSFYLTQNSCWCLNDIELTKTGQTSGTKSLAAGTYFISINLGLMGPGFYTVSFPASVGEPHITTINGSRTTSRARASLSCCAILTVQKSRHARNPLRRRLIRDQIRMMALLPVSALIPQLRPALVNIW